MDILLEKVNDKSIFFLNFLKIFKKKIYYLKIDSKKNKEKLFKKLKSLNVNPLPIEDLKNISYSTYSNIDFDPKNLLLKKTNSMHSRKISKLFLDKISSNSEEVVKLIIKDTITDKYTNLNGYLDFWLKENNGLIFITNSISSFFLINKKKKLNKIYLPYDLLIYFIPKILKIFYKILKSIFVKIISKIIYSNQIKIKTKNKKQYSTAFILHGDTFYGDSKKKILYDKTIYYSDNYNQLKKKNIIHFGYILKKINNKFINYQFLNNNILSFKDYKLIFHFFIKSLFYIRKFSDIYIIFILLTSLRYFYSSRNIFRQYPKLKIAMIDYDFLCPKSVILALMSLKIKTVGAQERFIASFYNTQNVLIDDYFTPSKKMNNIIKKNKSIIAKNLIPVGLYRADKISISKKNNNKKVIVALGFQTENAFYTSKVEMLLNWKASKLFLEDMYQLSKDLSDCKIIIRLKNDKSYEIPYFKKIIKKIESKKNIEIDRNIQTEHSYKICSKADLIISKHTSLADECISRGIPVIFYDYTHNMKGMIKGAFNYDNSGMISTNYVDMLNKTKKFISSNKNKINRNFLKIKKKYYFYDKNISVKKKIQNHLIKNL